MDRAGIKGKGDAVDRHLIFIFRYEQRFHCTAQARLFTLDLEHFA
jgi:hypothetical protein